MSCNVSKKEDVLDNNLYEKIIDYQTKFPIPKENPKNHIFVYKTYFWKDNKDTIIVLQRSSAGISKSDVGYGIYEDDKLHPTFIYDEHHLGDKLILKKFTNIENDKFYWKNGAPSESFPPTYTYVLKNKELRFVKIDTVWKKWD
jgi:hypothetical protein